MDTFQLLALAKKQPCLKGMDFTVIPSDHWKYNVLRENAAFISNIQDSKSEGSHWVSLYVDENKEAFYFDSYGNHPQFYHKEWLRYLRRYPKTHMHSFQVQSETTQVCGLHSLFAIMAYKKSLPLSSVYSQSDYCFNDLFISYFFADELKSIQVNRCSLLQEPGYEFLHRQTCLPKCKCPFVNNFSS
jgi:hypothetical protein